MRWAAYCRVSTEEQAERGTSLETQLERIKVALPPGETLVATYVDDGYSAASLDRPHLQRLLADARAKQLDGVMVYKTDRLSRSIKDIIRLVLDEFMGLGIVFKSATEPYDTSTPQGRLFFTQLAGFADFEREIILERSTLGRLKRAREGVYIGSHFVLGYRYDPKTRTLQQVPEEVTLVRRIFSMSNELNLGIQAIASRLNREAVPTPLQYAQRKLAHTPNGKLAAGKIEWRRGKLAGRTVNLKTCQWTTGTVWRILTNPLYSGQHHYNRRVSKTRRWRPREEWIAQPAVAEPIVSQANLQLAQQRIQERTKWHNRSVKHDYLLSGLLVCAECSQRLHGVTFKASQKLDANGNPLRNSQGALLKRWTTDVYYRCYGRHAKSQRKCHLPYAPAEKLDAVVWEAIRRCVLRPQEMLDEAFERQRGILSKGSSQLPRVIVEKERELVRTNRELDNLLALLKDWDLAEVKPRLEVCRTKRCALEAELAALRVREAGSGPAREQLRLLERSLAEIRGRIDQLSWHERRDLLRRWVTRIIVHPDKRLEVFGVLSEPTDNEITAENSFAGTGPRGLRRAGADYDDHVPGHAPPAQARGAACELGRRYP